MNKRVRILLAVLAALAVVAVFVVPRPARSPARRRESLGLTEFEERLDDGEVEPRSSSTTDRTS